MLASIDELTKLRGQLNSARKNTDLGTFYELLAQTMDVLDLRDKEVSAALGVSRPTVLRWRNGKTAPHSLMRPAVYEYLIERVDSQLAAERSKQQAASWGASGGGRSFA